MSGWLERAPWAPLIRHAPMIALVLVLALLPSMVSSDYLMRVAVQIGLYALLATGLNLVNGYGGMFSIGPAAFYGIGAYASALSVMKLDWPFAGGLLCAALLAAAMAWLVARPFLRLKGIYLSLVTLGFNIIVMLVLLNWEDLTRGPMGIAGIPAPSLLGQAFETPAAYFYLVLGLNVIVLFLMARLVDSNFGRALKAVREDDKAAAASGVDVAHTRVVAFTISGGILGICGSVYAHYYRYISPDAFSFPESFVIITMLAFGGPATLIGPVAGAVLLIGVIEVFRSFSEWRMIIYGVVLIVTMLFRREGLFGGWDWRPRIQWPRQPKQAYASGDRFLAEPESRDGPA